MNAWRQWGFILKHVGAQTTFRNDLFGISVDFARGNSEKNDKNPDFWDTLTARSVDSLFLFQRAIV